MENLLNQAGAARFARKTAFQMFGLKDDKTGVRCAKCGQWFNEDDGQWMPAQGVCEACYKIWEEIGIVCPKCGTKLEYNMNIILTSNPSLRQVRCKKCGFSGDIH